MRESRTWLIVSEMKIVARKKKNVNTSFGHIRHNINKKNKKNHYNYFNLNPITPKNSSLIWWIT